MTTSKAFLSTKPVNYTTPVLKYIEGLVSILQILQEHSRPGVSDRVTFLIKGYIEQMSKESPNKNPYIRFILSQPIKAPVSEINEVIGTSSDMAVCCLFQIRFMDEELMKNRKPLVLALSLDIKSLSFYNVGLSKSIDIGDQALQLPSDSVRVTG